jgi:hypothetical protein
MAKLRQRQFYCVVCRATRTLRENKICIDRDRNGRPRLVGECSKCDTTMYKYVKFNDEKKLERKYDQC